jgi:hypothetical protein
MGRRNYSSGNTQGQIRCPTEDTLSFPGVSKSFSHGDFRHDPWKLTRTAGFEAAGIPVDSSW